MNKLLPFTLVAFLFILAGCKKDDDTNEPPPVDPGPIELRENVHVIDSVIMPLNLSSSDLNNGTYVFNTTGTPPSVLVNDVIVGAQGEGFIRKVTSVTTNGTVVTMQTTQGTMEDVFKEGEFNFTIDMNDMNPGKTSGFNYTESNVMLYENGPLSVELLNASVNMDPEWFFDFKFSLDEGITKFEMSTQNTSYESSAEIKVTASQAVNLLTATDTLKSYTKLITKWVTVGIIPVPIVFRINVDWISEGSVDLNSAASSTVSFTSSASDINLGIKYINNQWEGIYNFNPTGELDVTQPNGQVGLTVAYSLKPKISVKLYGIAGPYASVALMTQSTGTVNSPAMDWDLKADAWVEAAVGLNVSYNLNLDTFDILGISGNLSIYADRNKTWSSDSLSLHRPDKIQRTSGDGQIADPNEALAQPIKVRILNSMGNGEGGVPVYFNVTSGGGSFNPESAISNASGYAQAYWTLGAQQLNTQFASVSAKYGDGSLINSAPIIFEANTTGLPIVSTFSASSITETTASTGGNVSNDGGSNVTARGVCWDTVPNPTTDVNAMTNGSGEGSFTSNLSSLTAGETYYVRAYATNSIGTVYGNQVNFTTTAIDSVPIYTAAALGNYRVNNYVGNGPNSELYCLLNSSGQAIYTIYNDPSWPDGTSWTMSWSIVFSNGRYYYLDNWWNGQNNISVDDPLTYPVTSFNYHNSTTYVMQ